MRLDSAVSDYALNLRASGRSIHTLGQYARHLNEFARWIGRDADLDSITTGDVARFMVSPETIASRSTGTLNALRSSLRCFLSFAHAAGLARQNAGRLLRLALRSPAPPRGLSSDEVRRLLDVLAKAQGWCARRDHLIVIVMLRAGLRIGSALGLDLTDLDFERRELIVRTAKGDAPERVPICRELADHLRVFVGGRADGPLFARSNAARLGKRQAQRRIEGWLRKAGITHGSAHALRTTFGQQIYERTHDLLLTKTAMRHRSVTSTVAYVYARQADVRRAIEA